MKKFIIRDRETGTEIEECNTYEEAMKQLAEYEAADKEDGTYEENFYEIVEIVETEM